MRRSTHVVAGALALGATAVLSSQSPQAQPPAPATFIVKNARVFDGERVHDNAQVAVEHGIIRAVGRDLSTFAHLPAIDGTGATLLPGLIDAHVHVRSADDLRQALSFGVTTTLDMGATIEPRALFSLRDTARTATDMADLRTSGFFATAPRGDAPPDPRASVIVPPVATAEEATQFVTDRRREGADYIKIMLGGVRAARGLPNLDEPRVKALVAAAHANQMLAVAHVETLEDVALALSAGIDGLVHVWRQGGANSEMAERVAKQGVFVGATLSIPDGFAPETRAALVADPRFGASDRVKRHLTRTFSVPGRPNLEGNVAATRSLHQAGARFVVATDASDGNPATFGVAVPRELELRQRAGIPTLQLLTAATAAAADAFRLHDRGRIVAGHRADLLMVRGDPTSDILATRDIVRVWRSGVEFVGARNAR
jgi:imidazolonepropionase-like amidohydrolase